MKRYLHAARELLTFFAWAAKPPREWRPYVRMSRIVSVGVGGNHS